MNKIFVKTSKKSRAATRASGQARDEEEFLSFAIVPDGETQGRKDARMGLAVDLTLEWSESPFIGQSASLPFTRTIRPLRKPVRAVRGFFSVYSMVLFRFIRVGL